MASSCCSCMTPVGPMSYPPATGRCLRYAKSFQKSVCQQQNWRFAVWVFELQHRWIPRHTLISPHPSPLPSPSSRPKHLGTQWSSFIIKYCHLIRVWKARRKTYIQVTVPAHTLLYETEKLSNYHYLHIALESKVSDSIHT